MGPAMILHLAAAVGTGPTELAAFDDALLRVGAANFNIIRLSSVIPPDTDVVACERSIPPPPGRWGDRLYAVVAEQRASRPGESAWAGIGWVQDATGRGLFVEHEGHSEAGVRQLIDASLSQLQAGRGLLLGEHRHRVIGGEATDQPICALVLCAYETEAWSTADRPDRSAQHLAVGARR